MCNHHGFLPKTPEFLKFAVLMLSHLFTRLFVYSMISAFEYFSFTISFISTLCLSSMFFPKHTTFTEFEGNTNTRSWGVNAFPLPILKNLYSSSKAQT